MKTSTNGIELIKSFEGFIPYAYDDLTEKRVRAGEPCKGTLTIGYGHTGSDVYKGQTCTKEQATKWLAEELHTCEKAVSKYKGLNQNQFDALVSFAYNCGTGALAKVMQVADPTEKMRLYTKSKGIELKGLVRRRKAEIELFKKPINKPVKKPTDKPSTTKYYKKCSEKHKSIVDGLTEIGVNSSYSNRQKIAKANNIKNYYGSGLQNTTMLKLLKQGKLIKA